MPTSRKAAIAVALSGGVDSSVAAMQLLNQGARVIGLTMHLGPLSGASHIDDAKRVASRLDIPLHVVDLAGPFESQVIAEFVSEYAKGRTPNPCVRCNQRIKFGALLEEARRLGAEFLATGHYARLEERNGRCALRRAEDASKDQSYVLCALRQEQLRRVVLPLGGLTKQTARQMASEAGLCCADRPESQDICFVPNGDYRTLLNARLGPAEPGPIVSATGEVLGEHQGLRRYTIGQRRGLGIAAPRPYYVIGLDAENNALVVGHVEETVCGELWASGVVWGGMAETREPFDCLAQIRYSHEPTPARARSEGNRLLVRFNAQVAAAAPGQWVVLYDGEYVIASGVIDGARPEFA